MNDFLNLSLRLSLVLLLTLLLKPFTNMLEAPAPEPPQVVVNHHQAQPFVPAEPVQFTENNISDAASLLLQN